MAQTPTDTATTSTSPDVAPSTSPDVAPSTSPMQHAQDFLDRDPAGTQIAVLGRDDAAKQAVFGALAHESATSEPRPLSDHMTATQDYGRHMAVSRLPAPSEGDPQWSAAVDECGMRNAGTVFAFVGDAADGATVETQLQATVDERWRLQGNGTERPRIASAFVTVQPLSQETRLAAGDGDDGDGAAAASGANDGSRFVIHGRGVTVTDVELRRHVSRLVPVRWPQPPAIDGSRGVTPGAGMLVQPSACGNYVNTEGRTASVVADAPGPFLVSVPTTSADASASDDSGSSGGATPTV